MIGGKNSKQLRHERHVQHRNNSQMQSAAQLTGFAIELLQETFELSKNRARVLLKNQSSRRKQNPFAAALEKRNTQPGFQIPHLLRHAGLGNAQPVGGAAEAAGLGDREEITQVANLKRFLHDKQIMRGCTGDCNARTCMREKISLP